jgi:uncharacterized protein (UPF0303 family)
VRGSMVGIAGVSGLPQRDDHALVVDALTAHRGRPEPRLAELRSLGPPPTAPMPTQKQ